MILLAMFTIDSENLCGAMRQDLGWNNNNIRVDYLLLSSRNVFRAGLRRNYYSIGQVRQTTASHGFLYISVWKALGMPIAYMRVQSDSNYPKGTSPRKHSGRKALKPFNIAFIHLILVCIIRGGPPS